MDIIYRLGEAGVSDVVDELGDDPGYNAIRNTMSILERKGYLQHRCEGKRYVYSPVQDVAAAQRSAIQHVVQTFFDGSLPQAVVAMLGGPEPEITGEELDEIARYLEAAREEAS